MSLEEKKGQLSGSKPAEPVEKEEAPEPEPETDSRDQKFKMKDAMKWAGSNEALKDLKVSREKRKELIEGVFSMTDKKKLTIKDLDKIEKKIVHEIHSAENDDARRTARGELKALDALRRSREE